MNSTHAILPQLYIHRPTLQKRHGRVVFHALTVLVWGAYLYLWLPLATLLLWWAAGRLGVSELHRYAEFVDLDLFVVVVKSLVVALVMMIGWAEYNRLRFQGVERRSPVAVLDPLETAEAMGATRVLGARLQTLRNTTVRMDEQAIPRELSSR